MKDLEALFNVLIATINRQRDEFRADHPFADSSCRFCGSRGAWGLDIWYFEGSAASDKGQPYHLFVAVLSHNGVAILFPNGRVSQAAPTAAALWEIVRKAVLDVSDRLGIES